jgi:hypothetical protein
MASATARRSILFWNTNQAWTDAFTSGTHRYLVAVNSEEGGIEGRVEEIPFRRLRDEDVDLVVLQNHDELELTARWLGHRPGTDVSAVYVEHNAPQPFAADSLHPLGGRDDIPIVHTTDFNQVMWNNGSAPSCVITPAMADPGHLFTGDVPAAASIIDEPLRRVRDTGADLLVELGRHAAIDVWGVDSEPLTDKFRQVARVRGRGHLPRPRLLSQLARRRVYVHPARWTSLDVGLIEAMYVGLPIVALASTMASTLIPPEAGVVSADVRTLELATEAFVVDYGAATAAGKAARDYAVAHFAMERFLAEWDAVIAELAP